MYLDIEDLSFLFPVQIYMVRYYCRTDIYNFWLFLNSKEKEIFVTGVSNDKAITVQVPESKDAIS